MLWLLIQCLAPLSIQTWGVFVWVYSVIAIASGPSDNLSPKKQHRHDIDLDIVSLIMSNLTHKYCEM